MCGGGQDRCFGGVLPPNHGEVLGKDGYPIPELVKGIGLTGYPDDIPIIDGF